MKIAVVFGANGFLGSLLVDKLVNNDVEVIGIYNSNFDKINKKAKLLDVEGILDSNIIPDWIFFLTGNYATSHNDLLIINDTLFKITRKFNKSKMIYISSSNVYGNSQTIISENSCFNNPGTYALSKISGEFIVSAMQQYSIIRLVYIYGSNSNNSSFVPTIIKSAIEDKTITLYGNGERKQDYIYIDDAVDLCILASKTTTNEIYLGATGKSISNLEVALEVQKYIPCEIKFTGLENGQSFNFDPSRTFAKLNWFPKTSFQEGIKHITK